jgi:predicted nucleic acid-binding protein
MVLVDSSIWIEAARRTGSLYAKVALEALLEEYEACWCGPVKLEVLGGARKEERAKLEFFFEAIPYRPMTDAAWSEAKALSWRLRDAGVTVPWNDVLIASLALTWDLRVFAQDLHFERISAISGLALYTPGYGGSYQEG